MVEPAVLSPLYPFAEALERLLPALRAASAGGRLRLSGLLRTGAEERPEKGLGELMQVLSQSRVVDQVQLEGCQAVSSTLSSFTLTAALAE